MLVQRLVLGIVLLALALPALQAAWPLVAVQPLGGYTDAVEKPKFSWAKLGDNSYQNNLELYLNDQLGFRPWLVRARNQLAYSGWRGLLTPGILLGKDQNLYQQGPINAYLGRDYLGEATIAFAAKRLRRVQDSLRAHGTEFLFVIAPGKPRILPQYLPDSCKIPAQLPATNYAMVAQQFAQHGVNTLDTTPLLLAWSKAPNAYPVFPRTGTHWSGYAVAQVADTLFRRIETLTGRDLPDFSHPGPLTVVTKAHELRYTDNDLGNLLNLASDIPPYPTAYPQVAFGPAAGKHPINALIIGDSYAQSFYGFYPFYDRLFTPESRYWNYNKHVFWPEQTPGESRNVNELNFGQQLAGRQLILMVAMEENLHQLGYDFINQAFMHFNPLTAADERKIAELIASIRSNPEWLQKVSEKAQEHGISLDEELRNNAVYMQDLER